MSTTGDRARQVSVRLLNHAQAQGFRGWDPYDALNSRGFEHFPIRNSRTFRLLLTQIFKRLPVDFRRAFHVPPHVNPKGLALYLDGALDLLAAKVPGVEPQICATLLSSIERICCQGYSGACWGYPFPWQGRAFHLPAHTPTVVATSYAGIALLNASLALNDSRLLEIARSACDFVSRDLQRNETEDGVCFSYSPQDRTVVHNASILGARLLARVGAVTGEEDLVNLALSAAAFTVAHQREDGAWPYGTAGNQQWVDHFHTGFILDCLRDCADLSEETSLRDSLDRGFSFYTRHLFLADGTPKYYDTRTLPLDAHCYAQAILTLLQGGESAQAACVAGNALRDLWHPGGYFCYQKTRWYRNQISYLRWSQAWMFRGLAALVKEGN